MSVHSQPSIPRSQQNNLNWRSTTLERQILPRARLGVGSGSRSVVAVKGLSSSAKIEDICEEKLLSGDIVEEVKGGGVSLVAPFAGGKTGLQRELRRLYNTGETSVEVKVKRGRGKSAQVHANIVPDESFMLKRLYVLRAKNDSSHIVTLIDSTEDDCLALQETRCARLVTHLANTQLKDGYVPYSWEDKIAPAVQTSSMVFSLLVLPYTLQDRPCMPVLNDIEDTVARAMAWFSAAQASGVPILFLNIQTEPLLTKVSGQQASSRSVSQGEDLFNIINTSMYGFEDYHGIDIGIVRAVRLWYVASVAEIAVVLRWEEGQNRLGLGINRTNEGFCYVSSVENDTLADRAGLKTLCQAARAAGKLLVITRVGEEKITPSMVSSAGSIRCFDTVSIGQKLSVHRQAGYPVRLHLIIWDEAVVARGWGTTTTSNEGRGGSKNNNNNNDPESYEAWEGRSVDPFGRQLGNEAATEDMDGRERQLRSNSDQDTSSEVESGSFDSNSSSDRREIEAKGELSFRFSNLGLSTDHF